MERLLLQGGAMGLFLALSAFLPREQRKRLISVDLLINLLNGLMLFVLLVPFVRWVEVRANIGLFVLPGTLHPVLQLGILFVLLDITRYWVHRADHRIPWLWTFHRVHHSTEKLDATAGLRMHAVDFFQLSAIPIVLFGVLLDTSQTVDWALPVALGIGVVMDSFQHSNLRFDLTKPWNRAWHMVLNNPHFHAWHHTRDGHICDGNYSNTLIIWDRIFGSDVTRPVLPEAYGLGGDQTLAGTDGLLEPQRIPGAVLSLQRLKARVS